MEPPTSYESENYLVHVQNIWLSLFLFRINMILMGDNKLALTHTYTPDCIY